MDLVTESFLDEISKRHDKEILKELKETLKNKKSKYGGSKISRKLDRVLCKGYAQDFAPLTDVLELNFSLKENCEERDFRVLKSIYDKLKRVTNNLTNFVKFTAYTDTSPKAPCYKILFEFKTVYTDRFYHISTFEMLVRVLHKILKQFILINTTVQKCKTKALSEISFGKHTTLFFDGRICKNPSARETLKEFSIALCLKYLKELLISLKKTSLKHPFEVPSNMFYTEKKSLLKN